MGSPSGTATTASELAGLDAWQAAEARRLGRPLRALLVGNIANNAYNNAKLLRRRGVECDVLCADYYHVMGTPEWEDAEFDGSPGDEFDPDWRRVDLKGFVRPTWFVQGPFVTAARHLAAARRGRRLAAWYWGRVLEAERTAAGRARVQRLAFIGKGLAQFARLTATSFIAVAIGALALLGVIDPRLVVIAVVAWFGGRILHTAWQAAASVLRVFGLLAPLAPAVPEAIRQADDRIGELVRWFGARFPDRADPLSAADLEPFRCVVERWEELLAGYDVVIGHATDGLLPLLARKPYIAYEHGTIRDIPFEASPNGRRCALVYAAADVVYMTNADSLPQALRLREGKRDAIVCGIHGVDLDRVKRQAVAAAERRSRSEGRFGIPDDVKVFFGPARQHWKDGFPTWLKGNDRVIRAAAALRARHPGKFKLVFAEWGKEVELSKALIRELGCEDSVVWVKPLAKKDLIHVYGSVDCVIDQFVLPCIGSVTIEALTVGKAPVITLLDDARMADFYGETIPLLNARTADEIAAAMETVVTDPEACRRSVEACGRWMDVHHSPAFQVESNLRAYKMLLERQRSPS